MQRQMRTMHGSVTTYDHDGGVLSHWEGEQQVNVSLHREPAVFKAFSAALRADENILSIAERFDTDHCTVLFWQRRLGLGRQPDIDCWSDVDDGEIGHD